MHAGNDRYAPMCVEYIFLGACLGYIQGLVLQAIFEREDLEVPQKVAVAQALGKILWIQNDLFMRWQLPQDTTLTGTNEQAHVARKAEHHSPSKPCSFLNIDVDSEEEVTQGRDTARDTSSPQTLNVSLHHPSSLENGCVLRQKDSSLLKLLRLTGIADGCDDPPLSQNSYELIERMRTVHVERLHDGSLELLLSPTGLTALQHEIERSGLAARLELDYDPWKPHQEAVDYFGLETAQKMFEEWTSKRARRLASVCGETGHFYRNLLQRHLVR